MRILPCALKTMLLLLTVMILPACIGITVAPEIPPYIRPDASGFIVSLHKTTEGNYQIVLWHPEHHPYAASSNSEIPFQIKLEGDAMSPSTASVEKTSFKSSEIHAGLNADAGFAGAGANYSAGSREEQRQVVAKTVWEFSPQRWAEQRPFRLTIIRGVNMKPIMQESRMVMEVSVGPKVGVADGLAIRLISMDPIPKS